MVRTLLGRKRPVPDLKSRRRNVRLYAERVVRNTPIQGTAADLMKLAMIEVRRRLEHERLDAPMILTVHDELVFEAQPAQSETVSALVKEVMAGVLKLDVPLVVDVGLGQTWAEARLAKIRGWKNAETPVVILGGGCDASAEDSGAATSMGNAVFVLDALDGTLLRAFTT